MAPCFLLRGRFRYAVPGRATPKRGGPLGRALHAIDFVVGSCRFASSAGNSQPYGFSLPVLPSPICLPRRDQVGPITMHPVSGLHRERPGFLLSGGTAP